MGFLCSCFLESFFFVHDPIEYEYSLTDLFNQLTNTTILGQSGPESNGDEDSLELVQF